MAHTFSFRTRLSYDTTKTGITVPVELIHGDRVVQADPKLDTGASFCIFRRAYAEALGLDVERGEPEAVSSVNGTFEVFGHWLTLAALGLRVDTIIYFAADERIRRSVLGRRGFVDQARLCLIEHDGELYASRYDEE